MRYLFFILLMMVTLSVGGCTMPSAANNEQAEEKQFILHPIGKVTREDGKTLIVLDKKYQPGRGLHFL